MTPLEARIRRRKDVAERRRAEQRCAEDWIRFEDEVGIHAKRCVRPRDLVCSYEYDPGPPPEDEELYERSPLGALWGLNTTEGIVDLLQAKRMGWIIRPRGVAA